MEEKKLPKNIIEKSCTIKIENGKSYLIETDEKKNLFINGNLVPIKKLVDQFEKKDEKSTYEEAKLFEEEKPIERKDYAMVKTSLCYLFVDKEKFPDIPENGSVLEIIDAIILRVWFNQPLQSAYEIYEHCESCWWIEGQDNEKRHSLPTTCSQMLSTNFDAIIKYLK